VTRETIFTTQKFRRFSGEDELVYTADQDVADDVSDCPRWRSNPHEHLHYSGQDLLSETTEAPHQTEVFAHPCIRRVGRLFQG